MGAVIRRTRAEQGEESMPARNPFDGLGEGASSEADGEQYAHPRRPEPSPSRQDPRPVAPRQDPPQQGWNPEQDYPAQGYRYPVQGYPGTGYPEPAQRGQGYAAPGYGGNPGQGYVEPVYPGSGNPGPAPLGQGYPGHGYPGQGRQQYPQPGYAQGGPGFGPQGQAPYGYGQKSRVVAGLLGVFFGGFGAHRFYLGHNGVGIAQVVLTVFTGTGVVWGFVEGLMILCNARTFSTDARGIPLK